MTASPTPLRPATFREGMIAILPISLAAGPIGLVYGALAVDAGLSPLEAALSSALIFAGSAQFLALELWEVPVPVLSLTVAAFLINLRHILMGIAITPHLPPNRPFATAGMLYLMTDEVWAMALRQSVRGAMTVRWYFGMGLSLFLVWNGWTVIGALAGALMGDPTRWGFDFAFVAIFIGLLGGFWTGSRTAVIWLAAAGAACAAKLLLPGPWYVLAGALVGVAGAAALWRPEDRRQGMDP